MSVAELTRYYVALSRSYTIMDNIEPQVCLLEFIQQVRGMPEEGIVQWQTYTKMHTEGGKPDVFEYSNFRGPTGPLNQPQAEADRREVRKDFEKDDWWQNKVGEVDDEMKDYDKWKPPRPPNAEIDPYWATYGDAGGP